MTETEPGILVPSGFTTVNSPTCTAYPMPSGNRTAPLDASAGGSATPAVTRLSTATQPSSGRQALQGQTIFALLPAQVAGTDLTKPPMLHCGIAVRPGYY